MKFDKFFVLAKQAGIEDAQLSITEDTNLEFSLFHSEVSNYENNSEMNILARGIINGKMGTASCDTWDNNKCKFLVDQIVQNAKVIEEEDPAFIFEGSPKYKKVNAYNKELENVTFDEKLAKLKELESLIKFGDPRIIEVGQVAYMEKVSKRTLINSKGLKLNSKSNYFAAYGVGVAQENGQVKSEFDFTFGQDFSKFDPKELAKRIVEKTVGQLGGHPCEPNSYKTVLAPSVVASFVSVLASYASSEDVQKKSSLFIDKVGELVASKKITIEDRPLNKYGFTRWFDDEGVATYDKPIIKNGVLQGYLYNLTTAAKDNTQSTGNGFGGSSIGVHPAFLYLKPGKKTEKELFEGIKEGVYITSVGGLHAGLNPQSGNFSLQSSGFYIKDGKLDYPLDLVTVSGNILKLFQDVTDVASNSEISLSGAITSSIAVKKLTIS